MAQAGKTSPPFAGFRRALPTATSCVRQPAVAMTDSEAIQRRPTRSRRASAVPGVHSLAVAYGNYVNHHKQSSEPCASRCWRWLQNQANWMCCRRRSPTSPSQPLLESQAEGPGGMLPSGGRENVEDPVKTKLQDAVRRHKDREARKCDQLLQDIGKDTAKSREKVKKQLPFLLPLRGRSGSVMLAYKVWLRFLVAYSSCLCIMILLAWFSGFLMEIFFSIFVPDVTDRLGTTCTLEHHVVITYLAFFLLPLGIVFTAFLGDELCDLVLDSVQQVPLTFCRATILAGLASDIHPVEEKFEMDIEKTNDSTDIGVEWWLPISGDPSAQRLLQRTQSAILRYVALGRILRIKKVKPGGLVERWNAANPEKIMKPGDRIVEVNGIPGARRCRFHIGNDVKGMVNECAQNTKLKIVFIRDQEEPTHLTNEAQPDHAMEKEEPITNQVYAALDMCMVICLNVVPGCCALNRYLTTYQVGPSLKAFIEGSAYGVLAFAVLFACTDVRISLDHNREKLRDLINEQLRVKHIFPSTLSLWHIRESINHHWEHEKHEWTFADQECAERVWGRSLTQKEEMEVLTSSKRVEDWAMRKEKMLWWLIGASGSLVLWIVTVWLSRHALSWNFTTHSASQGIFFGCVAMLMTICGWLSWGINKNMPGIVGYPFFAILAFFMLVSIVILLSGIQHLSAPAISPLMTVERNMTFQPSCDIEGNEGSCDFHYPWNGSEYLARYPVCNMAWGATTATLSSLDLAGLASISYATKPEAIQDLLDQTYNFSGRHVYHAPNYGAPKSTNPSDYEKVPRVLEVHFPSKNPNASGTRVFVIKGTSTALDAVTDASFFAGIEVLQFFDKIFPVLTVFPEWRIQWLLRPTFNKHTEDIEQDIFEEVEKRINKSQKDNPTDKVVLTGHSLGGGIAQIVAARTGIPALVWSAPGVLFSSHRFAKNVQDPWNEVNKFGELAKRSVTVVVPDHDPVPRVDEQIGMVQQVECRGRHGHLLYPWDCHPIKKTACEIWRVCGDPTGRDFRPACTALYVSPNNTGELYIGGDADGSRFNPWVRRSVAVIVCVLISSVVVFTVQRRAQLHHEEAKDVETGTPSGSDVGD